MKKIILVVGGVILIAVAGRVIWAYQQVKNDEARMANAPVVAATPTPEPAQVDAIVLPVSVAPTSTPTVTQKPVPVVDSASAIKISVATIKDCGTFEASHLFSGALATQDRVILECLNESIINCSPASTKLVGTGISVLKVLGKEGGNCIIEDKSTQKSVKPSSWEYYDTCKFPIDAFIVPLVNSLKKAGSTDSLFMGLAFMKTIDNAKVDSSGWFPNQITNSSNVTVSYKCK